MIPRYSLFVYYLLLTVVAVRSLAQLAVQLLVLTGC